MRTCRYCKAEEQPSEPFIDGVCYGCLNKIKTAKEASATADAQAKASAESASVQRVASLMNGLALMCGGVLGIIGGPILCSGGNPFIALGFMIVGSLASGGSLVSRRVLQHGSLAAVDRDRAHLARVVDAQDLGHAGRQRARAGPWWDGFGRDGLPGHALRLSCSAAATLSAVSPSEASVFQPAMAIFTCDRQPFHQIAEGLPTFDRLPGQGRSG